MNRGYSYTAKGHARSPPGRDRLSQNSRETSSFKNLGVEKQDLNIDDFGDMGSDEEDFQSLSRNFVPPKPPAKPQYNLVPYGLLRDDDELVEEDYDGVPIDDTTLQNSPKKQPWQSSPQKSLTEGIVGAPISVLGSSNLLDPLPNWRKNTTSQDSVHRNCPVIGGSSIESSINKISDSNRQLGADSWNKRSEISSKLNLERYEKIPSLLDSNIRKPHGFVQARNDTNEQTSYPSFIRSNDDGIPPLRTGSKPIGNTKSFIRSNDDSNPFLKMGPEKMSSGNAKSFTAVRDSSKTLLQSRESTPRWKDKSNSGQGSASVWAEKGRESSQRLNTQVHPVLTSTTAAHTSSQLELLQAAALQQALTGLTQLGSQSGLNLLGAQNLLMQATQNPTLAAALVSTGIRSIQPNSLNNPAVEALLKSSVSTAPDMTQSSSGLLTYPLRTNAVVNSEPTPRSKSIPDGSGATRYPAPDVSSLVFDPSTGYRFDASTGLHYDANSGYFFNSELKVFLRWDKFTQTYLKVDNPPAVPRFSNASTDHLSYVAGLPKTPEDKGQLSSSFSSAAFPKESHLAPLNNVSAASGLAPFMNAPTSSSRKENTTVLSSVSTIPTDFSKPPPPLPQSLTDTRLGPIGRNLSSVAEQRAAALPNFAETSLFNKLRKAKLAQTSQTKSDRQRWGSPDPLLEAAQKHAAVTNKTQGGILNMKEILQRSRQFMQQKTDNSVGESSNLRMQKESSRSRSGDQRKVRSRSRSVGTSSRRSRSPQRPGTRRGRSSISPQQRRRPKSRGRSPKIRGRGKPSLSPARKRKSVSRSRSPSSRTQRKGSLSPEARRRRSASRGQSPSTRGRGLLPEVRKRRPTSKGRSPLRRMGKSSKSPVPRHRKPRGRPSVSPELRKRTHQSQTPNRSLSPKMKVILDQSTGGSKTRVCSPGGSNKRSADQDLNAEKRKLRRKLSSSTEKVRALSPERKNKKDPAEEKTGFAAQNVVKDRLGTHDDRKENLKKGKVSDLKPIPYDSQQSSGKKSDKGKDVSGYKSLSNLRNQGKDRSRDKETDKKQETVRHDKTNPATGIVSTAVDLTADSDDDDRRGRANHRLVSERTFSSGWGRKNPVPNSSPLSKSDITSESCPLPKSTEEKSGIEDTNIEGTEQRKQREESNEFDFLNDTLDDDKESTVIDEYEEILDYQDLEGTSDSLEEKGASSPKNTDAKGGKESLSTEPLGSPVIDLYIDAEECAVPASTSTKCNPESMQCSSAEDNKLVEISSEKLSSLRNGAAVAQGEVVADVSEGREVGNEDRDGIKLHDLDSVVGESAGEKDIKRPDTCGAEKEGSEEASYVPPARADTPKVGLETKNDHSKFDAVDKAYSEMNKDEPNMSVVSQSEERASDELVPDLLENEEWNVVDSVDDGEELTEGTVPSGVDELSGKNQEDMMKPDLVESVTQNAAATDSKDDGKTGELDNQLEMKKLSQQVSKDDAKSEGHDFQVSHAVSHNDEPGSQISGRDKPDLQGSNGDDTGKRNDSQTGIDESLLQVRSVSDIEKFLLLSSQEVEAKRELGIESTTTKNDKKSGVFSRLGEKLPTDDTGDEPTVVLELPPETSVSAPGPSCKVSAFPTKPPKPATKRKPAAASKSLNKSKIADPVDPVGMLFDDIPAPHVLIGPMNFIEPLQNFQHFTQKYMMRLLEKEKVKFKKVLVCHEDVTGAPYHYILITFHSDENALDWFKKHKGRFKADDKLFKMVAGHLKQKFIPNAETFLHFTDCNWFCKVCKKSNFPPRSLCFNCFHHKDPEGFSPLTILDKVPATAKRTNFVGAPKLKFFVTKEKVIESAPPLDGFDIKSINMIMDESMGFPAGICVFELPDYISAGKLKKYLNRREVEAVMVQMHENPKSVSSGLPIAPSRKIAQKVSGGDVLRHPSDEKVYRESGEIRECSPRHPSQDFFVQVSRDRSPTPPREIRAPRGQSSSPVRDVRVPKGRLPSPPLDVPVSRRRPPNLSPEARIPRERSPSQELRFHRGRSPSLLRQRHSRERFVSRSPRRHSPGYQPRTRSREVYEKERCPSPESRSRRNIPLRGRPIRESSPRLDTKVEARRLRSREHAAGYRSPVPCRSPGYRSPARYRSRSPACDPPRRRPPSPRYRSPSPGRPIKPDGTGDWSYPPPDPTDFRFEPKSGLDYDPTTTLYYEPNSCCFYNDETNEWLEYNPRTGRYTLVR